LEDPEEILFEYNFNMQLTPLSNIPKTVDDFKIYCFRNNISAAIFVNVSMDDKYICGFSEVMPVIVIGTKFDSGNLVTIRSDNYSGSYDAVRYLISKGHERIVFCVPDLKKQDYSDRYRAYRDLLEKNGLSEINKDNVIEYSKCSINQISTILERKLIGSTDKPTAFFVNSDQQIMQLMSILNNIGLYVPEDISVVGFDDNDFSEFLRPPITTVRQPFFRMGREAGLSVIKLLNSGSSEFNHDLTLDTELIVRKSVASV
ncbi:LacI family transcriptional regulator, partial [Candidatus Nomurabacteria bacterium]|nr:LacI family transcriptional regulator [Candidatus Nomurabacteria bacterium]